MWIEYMSQCLIRKLIKSRPDILNTRTQKVPLCPAWLLSSNDAKDTAAGKQFTQWHPIQRFPFLSPAGADWPFRRQNKSSDLNRLSHLGFVLWSWGPACVSWDYSALLSAQFPSLQTSLPLLHPHPLGTFRPPDHSRFLKKGGGGMTSDITVWLHTKDAPGWEKTLGSWRGGGEDSNPTFHTSLSQFTALTTKRPFMLLVLVHAKGSLDVIWAPTKILIMYNSIWKRELLCPRNFARALR